MKKIKLFSFLLLILFFTNCEKEDYKNEEVAKMTSTTISKTQLLNELKDTNIINFIVQGKYFNSITQYQRENRDSNIMFEKIVKPNDFITYSLKLNNYSSAKPFIEYFIINQDENGEKAGFVKYIPSTPTLNFDVTNFSGDIEIYSTDYELFAKTSFLNGQVLTDKNTTSNRSCINVSYLVGMPCSHGGNHMPGESCEEGFTNDAYYVVRTTVVCVNTIKTITPPDEFGGSNSGSGGSANFLTVLNIPNLYEGEDSLNNPSFLFYLEILTFLENNPTYNNLINHNYASATFLNDWLVPTIVDYFRINGFDNQNQINVINTLNSYIQYLSFESNQYNFEQLVIQKYKTFQLLLQNDIGFSNQTTENQQIIYNYLIENNLDDEALEFVEELINAANEYIEEYGNNQNSIDFINQTIKDIINDENIEDEEEIVTPPDCASFNFTQSGTANWQEAAVTNIHFQINILSPQASYVNFVIEIPQPVLFGMPITPFGYPTITPGLAATNSAKAVRKSMNETVKRYGNKPVTNLIVELYFKQRLKYNYPIMTNGGRVNFNSSNLNVIPTQYQTVSYGTGNCN